MIIRLMVRQRAIRRRATYPKMPLFREALPRFVPLAALYLPSLLAGPWLARSMRFGGCVFSSVAVDFHFRFCFFFFPAFIE